MIKELRYGRVKIGRLADRLSASCHLRRCNTPLVCPERCNSCRTITGGDTPPLGLRTAIAWNSASLIYELYDLVQEFSTAMKDFREFYTDIEDEGDLRFSVDGMNSKLKEMDQIHEAMIIVEAGISNSIVIVDYHSEKYKLLESMLGQVDCIMIDVTSMGLRILKQYHRLNDKVLLKYKVDKK